MSWLAVDKSGNEHIFAEKPCRNESNALWICSVVYLYGQRFVNVVTFQKALSRNSSEGNYLGMMNLSNLKKNSYGKNMVSSG